ncbi:N-acylneuraminate cytidylyltransferase A-like [Stegodyphus dumicola]|uniref:N-acylneuraminate cytidylyltransferase A-like n=1 Tax=Stegodyphus dumicola TaxID=202533 RepID=UPI0015B22221|nr:N-acylneuraminate cytidylyltransferase A-like [Stegodyphus dumicola]
MEGRGNTTSGIGCHICGLVLARGGSVRVPRKNVRSIAGLPLLAWVLHPMLDCKRLTSVWVSTDDTEIAEVALRYGAQVHYRDKKTAKDCSSSLIGVQEFLLKHPGKQPTFLIYFSYFLYYCYQMEFDLVTHREIRQKLNRKSWKSSNRDITLPTDHEVHYIIKALADKKAPGPDGIDNIIVKEIHKEFPGESTEPLNFNPRQRPRSQDWNGELVESGHFYVSRVSLIKENLLQGKRCGYVEMPEELCIDIDSETDWIIAEKLLELYGYRKNVNELKEYYV